MPKYYVECGKVQMLLLAESAEQAAAKMAERVQACSEDLSVITTVSETGFELTEDTVAVLTSQLFGPKR